MQFEEEKNRFVNFLKKESVIFVFVQKIYIYLGYILFHVILEKAA